MTQLAGPSTWTDTEWQGIDIIGLFHLSGSYCSHRPVCVTDRAVIQYSGGAQFWAIFFEEEVVFISSWRALLFFSFCLVFWFHCSLYSFALQGKPSFSSPLSPFWVQTPLVARIFFSSHLPFRGIIRVYKFGNININFLPQRIAG